MLVCSNHRIEHGDRRDRRDVNSIIKQLEFIRLKVTSIEDGQCLDCLEEIVIANLAKEWPEASFAAPSATERKAHPERGSYWSLVEAGIKPFPRGREYNWGESTTSGSSPLPTPTFTRNLNLMKAAFFAKKKKRMEAKMREDRTKEKITAPAVKEPPGTMTTTSEETAQLEKTKQNLPEVKAEPVNLPVELTSSTCLAATAPLIRCNLSNRPKAKDYIIKSPSPPTDEEWSEEESVGTTAQSKTRSKGKDWEEEEFLDAESTTQTHTTDSGKVGTGPRSETIRDGYTEIQSVTLALGSSAGVSEHQSTSTGLPSNTHGEGEEEESKTVGNVETVSDHSRASRIRGRPADSDTIDCKCGFDYDDSRAMISCDHCKNWQHKECMKLPEAADVDGDYLCHICEFKVVSLVQLQEYVPEMYELTQNPLKKYVPIWREHGRVDMYE